MIKITSDEILSPQTLLREGERERESPIQVRICYNEWVFATVANTH